MQRTRVLLLALLVALLVFVVFWPALDAGWVKWDDDRNFLQNEAWRGLGAAELRWMATSFHLGPYQPLSWLSLGLDHAAWGMEPRGYHLTNVALHALGAVALLFLARKLFARLGASGLALDGSSVFAALAFALHPLRAESVAWITERRDVLSGLLLILALIAWLGWTETRSRAAWAAALTLFLASLLAKGLGMMLPPVLVVLDALVLRRALGWRGHAREKWPFFLLALGFAALAWHGQRSAGTALIGLEHQDAFARILTAAHGLVWYLRALLWPVGLCSHYPLPHPFDATEARFVWSALALVALAIALVLARRRWPGLCAAGLAHVLFLLPVIGLVQAGPQLVADRYSYLPSLGWALLAGWGVARAFGRDHVLASLGCVLVLGALGAGARAQTRTWHDTMTLFQRVCDVRPADPLARRNLVLAWLDEARARTEPAGRRAAYDEALRHCAIGIERAPDPGLLHNAAVVFDDLARLEPEQRAAHVAAELDNLRKALELGERKGDALPAVYELAGRVLASEGRWDEAVVVLQRLVNRFPADANQHVMLAEAQLGAGRPREALPTLQSLARSLPEEAHLWLDLGQAHAALGEKEQARAALTRCIELLSARADGDPDLPAARKLLESLK